MSAPGLPGRSSGEMRGLCDRCTLVANADQLDTNGNTCDADLANVGIVNPLDLGLFRTVFFTRGPDADVSGDGIVNPLDLGILRGTLFGAPRPSALAP